MSFVRPSFSHAFLNRRSICSAVSFPRAFTLIIGSVVLSVTPVTPGGDTRSPRRRCLCDRAPHLNGCVGGRPGVRPSPRPTRPWNIARDEPVHYPSTAFADGGETD